MDDDAAYEFSKFIVKIDFEDLSPETIEVAKKSVLDTLAAALGGSGAYGIQGLCEIVEWWGGRQESTIISFGIKVPCPNAAFVNSAMAHALDLDDTFMPGFIHPSSVVVPSAFAISESRGGIDGKKFIASICVAIELGCRIGSATQYRRLDVPGGGNMGGWDNTSIIGFFEAASLGKLLDLDQERIHNALGIAYMQASGNTQCLRDGTLTKRMGPGFASKGGIISAFMAERGITGAKRIFESEEAGYYVLYHEGYDREILLGNLGREFMMEGMAIKPHTSCKLTHAAIDAALNLVNENDLKANDVQEITAFVSPRAKIVCEPEEFRKKPVTIVDAQFSIPWVIACAVVRRRVQKTEFTNEAIHDPDLLAMAAKVKTIIDPSITSPDHAKVGIKTQKAEFETKILDPYGTPGNPMSYEDISRKFIECASDSIKPTPEQNMKTVIEMVNNLEEVKDVAEIIGLLG